MNTEFTILAIEIKTPDVLLQCYSSLLSKSPFFNEIAKMVFHEGQFLGISEMKYCENWLKKRFLLMKSSNGKNN